MFLNLSLLIFVFGYVPSIAGRNILPKSARGVSNISGSEVLSHIVPLGFVSYWLYAAYSKYSSCLESEWFVEEAMPSKMLKGEPVQLL